MPTVTSPQQPGFVIGVDLGTSNTVAVVRAPDGRTRPLLFDGQPVMPSTVYVDDVGRIHVGRDAQRMAQLDPARCEPNPKHRIDERTVLLGDRELPVVHLLAAILKAVADKTVETVGFLPPAVLTHPAAWGTTRRGVLLEAVRQAGWPPVTLVPEPIAAARYFAEVLRRPVPVGSSIAVFDFGGGTLDVAVVRNDGTLGGAFHTGPSDPRAPGGAVGADPRAPGGSPFSVIGSGGDENLGGLDLDAALVTHVGGLIGRERPQIWQHLSQPQSTVDRRYRRLFWEDVRGAKEMLSRSTTAPVPVPGADHAVHLTREELERLIGPLLERAVAAAEATISRCGLRADQLTGLFLVGGSSRVPLMARMLHSRLGIAPTVLEQPELPVAEGALAEFPLPDANATAPTVGMAYPMSAAPASGGPGGMPVGAMTGQSGPVSAAPASPAGAPGLGAPPGQYPPGGYPQPGPPHPPMPWYKRKHLMIPAGAAAAVLLLVLALVLFHDPYQERDFASLKPVGTFAYSTDSPGDEFVTIDGNQAYVADATATSDDFGSNNDKLTVQSFTLGDKKTRWKTSFTSPNHADWAWISAADGVLMLRYGTGTDADYHTIPGGLVVVDQDSHQRLWTDKKASSDDDQYVMVPDTGVVLHYNDDAGTVTGLDADTGTAKWTIKHAGSVHLDHGWPEYTSAAYFGTDTNWTPAKLNSTRFVFTDDTTTRVADASTGTVTGHRQVDSDGAELVYRGMLYDAGGESGYTLRAYPLDDIGRKATWTTPVPQGWKISSLDVCGESLICATEYKAGPSDTTSDDGSTRQIRVFDADSGEDKWHHKAPQADDPVPVGDRIVVTYQKHEQPVTEVFDSDGNSVKTWPGYSAARLDDAEILLINSGIGDSTDASGKALLGGGVQSTSSSPLGTLGSDATSCVWNDDYLVCPGSDTSGHSGFVVYRFRN